MKLHLTTGLASTEQHHTKMARPLLAICLILVACWCWSMVASATHEKKSGSAAGNATAKWENHGANILNWRNQVEERRISPSTVGNLRLQWVFETQGDVTATPSVADGVVYFPSWDGNLYAVDEFSGDLQWSVNLTETLGGLARATPTICGKYLLVGISGPAIVAAFDRESGSLLWDVEVESAPLAIITMSGTCYEKYYYVGTSSNQEVAAVPPLCCTFIGSVLKMEIATGAVIWKTLMLPDNGGQQGLYSGAAVWGSSPPIDVGRRLLLVGTGNLYSAPANVTACEEAQQELPEPEVPDPCIEPENRANAIVALHLDDGTFVWHTVLGGYSAWTYACLVPGNPNCPAGPGTDYDFGEAPLLISPSGRDLAVVGQKSGTVWALDRDTGAVVWGTAAAPGGVTGGAIWGCATDGLHTVFSNMVNTARLDWTLSSGEVINYGGWVALDALDGSILWSVGDYARNWTDGPPSYANGVLFTTSAEPSGSVFALDAASGALLWRSDLPDSSIYGGFSIADSCVFCGEGYSRFQQFGLTPGNKAFAFCLPHHET